LGVHIHGETIMPKEKEIQRLKAEQEFYSNALAAHATSRQPTAYQQALQDGLFASYERVTASLDTLL